MDVRLRALREILYGRVTGEVINRVMDAAKAKVTAAELCEILNALLPLLFVSPFHLSFSLSSRVSFLRGSFINFAHGVNDI